MQQKCQMHLIHAPICNNKVVPDTPKRAISTSFFKHCNKCLFGLEILSPHLSIVMGDNGVFSQKWMPNSFGSAILLVRKKHCKYASRVIKSIYAGLFLLETYPAIEIFGKLSVGMFDTELCKKSERVILC